MDRSMVSSSEVEFMAFLADAYNNERFSNRLSGATWNIYTQISKGLFDSSSSSLFKSSSFTVGINGGYYLPLKKKWQLNIDGTSTMRLLSWANSEKIDNTFNSVEIEISIQHLLNARTNLTFGILGFGSDISSSNSPTTKSYILSGNFRLTYFISPYTNFQINISPRFSGTSFDIPGFNDFDRRSQLINFSFGHSFI